MDSEERVTINVETIAGEDSTRSKFGTRYLTDPHTVFQHNAWDNAVWDEEQEIAAQNIAMNHAEHAASTDKRDEYEREAGTNWDKFYNIHTNHFFKDRHWLFTEFPELYGQDRPSEIEVGSIEALGNMALSNKQKAINSKCEDSEKITDGISLLENSECIELSTCESVNDCSKSFDQPAASMLVTEKHKAPFTVLEVGCGVGNTVFPILKTNRNPNLFIYCCDFSTKAVDIVKAHSDYDEKRCHAFVHDITDEKCEVPFALESLDIIILIFVLSAISPEKMQDVVNRLASYLKPGGTLLFRDYGRYDMAQLRFKKGRCLSENFYVRGDGTRVYFFTQDDLRVIFERAHLQEKENIVDRRLQINRGRQLKMYRVWIQCKYMKPLL